MTLALVASGLAGCGLVPDAFPLLSHEEKKALFAAVVRGVQCEIRRAVLEQLNDARYGRSVEWLKNWSALINLQLTFDETLAFNPGVSFTTPNLLDANVWLANGTRRVVSQAYNFGVGGQAEGERSRTETIEYFYPFDNFLSGNDQDNPNIPCYHTRSFFIVGDLKLRDWLDDVLEPFKHCAFLGSPGAGRRGFLVGLGEGSPDDETQCSEADLRRQGFGKDNPITTFSHNVTFKLRLEVDATPHWTLVRIEAPISPQLFTVSRKDTSELLITLGSASTRTVIARRERGETARPVVGPSAEMEANQSALRIGAAVANANALLAP